MTMRPEARDVPRWLQPDSDASLELRALAREASALPDDGARIARLRARLGPWLAAGVAAEALRPETQVAPQATVSAPPAAAGAGIVAKAAAVALGTSVAITSTLGWLGPDSAVDRRRTAVASGPRADASAPARARASLDERPNPGAKPSSEMVARPRANQNEATAQSAASPPPALGARGRDSLAEQASLLSRARRLLDVAPAQALELLSEHARRFPNSTLSEERRLFTIHALARAGRTSEAERELERFERSSPSSPHLTRARRLISPDRTAP